MYIFVYKYLSYPILNQLVTVCFGISRKTLTFYTCYLHLLLYALCVHFV